MPASPNARRVARELGVDLAAVTGSGPGGRVVSEDVEAAAARTAAPAARAPATPGAAAAVSPIVRRRAGELGVDLAGVRGSGPGGRVLRADVEAAAGPAAGPAAGERIPLTGMRGTIARRMHRSLQEMAQLTLVTDVEAGPMVELRRRLAGEWGDADLPVPGYTDLVVKATALALRDHPRLNATIAGDHIELLTAIDVGLAVALDDGLVVPVVRAADALPLDRLARETARLADAARVGALTRADVEGGTFTVSPLGMFGIDAFTPVVNPPNVAILGVGRIRPEVVPDGEGGFAVAERMTLSLTIDHRAVDGAPGARFLQTVAALLAAPLRLLAT